MNHCYRFFFLCFFLLLSAAGWAQTSSSNYIISRTYKQAGIIETFNTPTFSASSNQASSQISYFDGLGKPTQQVMAFEAASKGDVVILTEYDNLQRPVRTFLPAPFKNNGGEMRSADAIKSAAGYYKDASKVSAPVGNDEALAAQTVYDNTPLGRVSTQKAPGASSVVSQVYGVNSDGDVKLYQVSGTGTTTSLQPQGNYPAGSLTWTQTTDENGGQITEFQDRYGRTVLRRVKATDDTKLDTYYIYDEKGQLRVVLQPKYASFGENDLNKNAFLYSYDDRGRLISKKVPGANAVQMTYKGDTELVETSTDGKNTVFYYKYDNLNRQVEMGVKPGGSETPLLYTYYDNYSFNPFQYFTNDLNITASPFANNPQQARTGLTTGTKARVLKPDSTFGDWLQTAIYYDDKYRVVQTVRQLYGFSWQAFERVSYKLSFDGKPEEEWITQATGSITYKLTKKYSYDHANRLIKTDHVLYENDVQKKAYTHTEQLYNEVGKLAAKSLHKGRQILTYKYTPRGWLGNHQTSNGQPFSLNLSYQDNGNITQQSWATKSYSGGMDLSYDKASRLTGATGTGNFGGYHENPIQYDPNGNITNLTRQYNGLVIDQLGYQYHGNQLHRVDDNSDNQSQAVKGFINNANADDELSYDANGNMVKDDNRGVTNIAYNVLNLPSTVTRNGRTVQYTYDAKGTKHKTEAPDNVNTFYAGAFEYRAENSLLRIGLEEGQLVKSDTFIVHYYLRDHLGNVRSVMDENGTIIQETEYYAFGLPIQRNGSDKNKYLYNGKEKQPETEWQDYGARMYEPTVGRWMVVDPKAEKMPSWSSYSAFFNNPIRFIDPDGQEPTPAEAARMAAHVYGDKKNNILTGGWRVSQRDFGIQLQDASGLKSLVYEREVKGKVTEYVYATAGTEASWSDVGADVKQPLGLSKQYSSAAFNAGEISNALGKTELNFVGHSLGGGEAALNSLVTSSEGLIGRKAFTFNAAGVGAITKFEEGDWKTPFKSEKNIDAYILRTDPLNSLQNNSPIMPDVNGNRHYLWPKDIPSAYNGHSMDNMLKNFGVKNPDEYKK